MILIYEVEFKVYILNNYMINNKNKAEFRNTPARLPLQK